MPGGGVPGRQLVVTQPPCRDNGLMGRSIESQDEWSISGADFLQLDRADAPAGGLADWLAQHLRRAISDGRLPVGSRLPATRVLAGGVGVGPRGGAAGAPRPAPAGAAG